MRLFGRKPRKVTEVESTPIAPEMNYQEMYMNGRTPSAAYREGTKEAIQRVLETVEEQAEKRVKDGFSEINFTAGVLNCFFIEFMFTSYPQHLWLVYLIEAMYLFPAKVRFLLNTKPLNSVYYLLDYCWVMNGAGVLTFIIMFAGQRNVPNVVREQLFLAAYGTAIGPLLGATLTLPFVSLIFHNLDFMTSVFIHFYPPLLFYILRWLPETVHNAWPNAFDLDYEVQFWPNGSFTGNVFGNTIIAYLLWFIPYTLWQLFIGLDLPRQTRQKILSDGSIAPTVYDTVYHNNMRAGLCVTAGKRFWNRPKEVSLEQCKTNDFELRDFIVYMAVHFFNAIMALIFLAYPCYLSKYVHGFFLWVLLALCTYRGGKRYTYYSTKMYAKIIRKHFADEINSSPNEFVGAEDTPSEDKKEDGYQTVKI